MKDLLIPSYLKKVGAVVKSKILLVIGIIALSLAVSFLYAHVVVFDPGHKFVLHREVVNLKESMARVSFNMPRDAYLLKIKHIILKNHHKGILVNGLSINSNLSCSRRGIVETSYFYVPREVMRSGENILEVYFSENWPSDIDVQILNYQKEINNRIYILFPDSINLPSGEMTFQGVVLPAFLISFFLLGSIYFLRKLLSLNLRRLFVYELYSLLPFFMFLISIFIFSEINKTYKVVISSAYFWLLGFVSFFFCIISIVSIKLFQGYLRKDFLIFNPKALNILIKAFKWFRKKELSDKCVIFFMLPLLVCPFFLILNLESMVNGLISISYLSLVGGLSIKLIKFSRGGGSEK
ncbi:MAG: hypothetical protein P9M07_01705 [Candidatus Aceula meridiana]|nr:hypothetical protein [Candidatus Aceula meridiana]